MKVLWDSLCNQIKESKKDYKQIIEVLSSDIIERLLKKRSQWIKGNISKEVVIAKQSIIALMMRDLLDMEAKDFIEFTQDYPKFCRRWVLSKMDIIFTKFAIRTGK